MRIFSRQKVIAAILVVFTVFLVPLLMLEIDTSEVSAGVTCRVGCHNPITLFPRPMTPNLNNEVTWDDSNFVPALCGDCHDVHNTMASQQTVIDPLLFPEGITFKSSHMVDGKLRNPADDKTECEVCHDQSQHQQGQVRLIDYATPATIYTFDMGANNALGLEPFCLSCHTGQLTAVPFPMSLPGVNPPDVSLYGGWDNSKHKMGGNPYVAGSTITINLTCLGTEVFDYRYPNSQMVTYGCHQNAHGSAKQALFLDAFEAPDPEDDNLSEFEGFCYSCHMNVKGFENIYPGLNTTITGDPYRVDISLHKWDDLDDSTIDWNCAAISCMECHNPHYQGEPGANDLMWQHRGGQVITNITEDPINPALPFTMTEKLCFDCHDDNAPDLSIVYPECGTVTYDMDDIMSDDIDFSNPAAAVIAKHQRLGSFYDSKQGVCTKCHTHNTGFRACGCHPVPPDDCGHNVHVGEYDFNDCHTCHLGYDDIAINPNGHPSTTWLASMAPAGAKCGGILDGCNDVFLNFPGENAPRSIPPPGDSYVYIESYFFPGGTRIANTVGVSTNQIPSSVMSTEVECWVGCHNPIIQMSCNEPKNVNNIARWKGPVGAPECDQADPDSLPCVRCHDSLGTAIDSSGSAHPIDTTISGDCSVCHDSLTKPFEKIDLGGGDYAHHTSYVEVTDEFSLSWPQISRVPTIGTMTGNLEYINLNVNETVQDTSYCIDYTPAESDKMEDFCLECHDGSFADCDSTLELFSLAGSMGYAPNIKRWTLWENSMHKTGGEVPDVSTWFEGLTCVGDPSITENLILGCHTPHGSLKKHLLAPANEAPGTNNVNEEEGFCFKCHTDSSVAKGLVNYSLSGLRDETGTCYAPNVIVNLDYNDIQEAFNQGRHHPVNDGDQASRSIPPIPTLPDHDYLECTNCHAVHWVSGKWKNAPSGVSPFSLYKAQTLKFDNCGSDQYILNVLWGDDSGEKARDAAAQYGGYGSEMSLYQPDGYCCGGGGKPAEYYVPKAWWEQSDQMPDTTTQCMECHTDSSKVRSNYIIGGGCGWENCNSWGGDAHGGGLGGMGSNWNGDTYKWWGGDADHPNGCDRDAGHGMFIRNNIYKYVRQATRDKFVGINFVNMCTDCHDPHGAGGSSMFRTEVNNAINTTTCAPNLSATGSPIWNTICNQCHWYYGGHHTGMSCGNASCHERNSIHKAKKLTYGSGVALDLPLDGSDCAYPPKVGSGIQNDLVLHWDFDSLAEVVDNYRDINVECTTCGNPGMYNLDGFKTGKIVSSPSTKPGAGAGDNMITIDASNTTNPNLGGIGSVQLNYPLEADTYPVQYGPIAQIIPHLGFTYELTVQAWVYLTPVDQVQAIAANLGTWVGRTVVETWNTGGYNFALGARRVPLPWPPDPNPFTDPQDDPRWDTFYFRVFTVDPDDYSLHQKWCCNCYPDIMVTGQSNGHTPKWFYWNCDSPDVGVIANTKDGTYIYRKATIRTLSELEVTNPLLNPDAVLKQNDWNRITGVFDGYNRKMRIYINGKLSNEDDLVGGNGGPVAMYSDIDFPQASNLPGRYPTSGLAAGGQLLKWTNSRKTYWDSNITPGGKHFYQVSNGVITGSIDDVKIWLKALTPDEVRDEGCYTGNCHPQLKNPIGSHLAHFADDDHADYKYGPRDMTAELANNCDNCHGSGATTGDHVGHDTNTPGRPVVFADGLTLHGIDETKPEEGTKVCDTCHGIDNTVENQQWRTIVRRSWPTGRGPWIDGLSEGGIWEADGYIGGQDDYCGACHGIRGDASILARVNTIYGTGGVDLEAQDAITYLHSGLSPSHSLTGSANLRCLGCHEKLRPHIDPVEVTSRMILDSGASGTGLPFVPKVDDKSCTKNCHNNTTTTGVSTHSNAHWMASDPFVQLEPDFPGDPGPPDRPQQGASIRCIRCHNVHGSSNLSMIREKIKIFDNIDENLQTVRDVVFTSTTGPDSFDEGDEGIGDASDSDDLCVICHVYESPPGTFVSYMATLGGDHSATDMGKDFRGTDCTLCHLHDTSCFDPKVDSLDGFMPKLEDNCLDCHTTGGVSQYNTDVEFDGIGNNQANGLLSQHLISYDTIDYGTRPCYPDYLLFADVECKKCHGESHPTEAARVVAPDTGLSYSSSNVGGRPRDNLVEFCLSCHDGHAADDIVTSIQLGEVGSDTVTTTIPAGQFPPRHGAGVEQLEGPWNPNPTDYDPGTTGLPTYANRYGTLFTQTGHGSDVPLDPARTEGYAYSCVGVEDDTGTTVIEGCHDYHGSTNYRLIKDLPGKYDGEQIFTYNGDDYNNFDNWCTFTCHVRVDPRVSDHTDNSKWDAESGDLRDAWTDPRESGSPQRPSHPTSANIPFFGSPLPVNEFYNSQAAITGSIYIGSYLSPPTLPNPYDVLCVTCHDPHGSDPVGEADAQMVRIKWNLGKIELESEALEPDLCDQCHQ